MSAGYLRPYGPEDGGDTFMWRMPRAYRVAATYSCWPCTINGEPARVGDAIRPGDVLSGTYRRLSSAGAAPAHAILVETID